MQLSTQSLSPQQQAYFDLYPPTHAFAVVTWGCTASSWLSRALNSHPDIFCVHSSNGFWNALGKAPHLDGPAYLRLIASQGYAHKAAGDVHGVSRFAIPALKAELGDAFGCAVVVREPIVRLHSQLALFKRFESSGAWQVEYLEQMIAEKLTLPDQSYPTRLFVHGVNMLNAIVEEHSLAPLYRTEDLTRKPETLCHLIETLTGGKVEPTYDWAQTAIAQGKVNAHRTSTEPPKFEDWQMDVIHKVVQPEAWELYAELGYPIPNFTRS